MWVFRIAEADYSRIFERYKQLSPDIKAKFNEFRAANYAKAPPPAKMQKDLERIVERHQSETKAPIQSAQKPDYFYGLVAILAGIAILSGVPYTPMPLY